MKDGKSLIIKMSAKKRKKNTSDPTAEKTFYRIFHKNKAHTTGKICCG